MYTLGYSFKPWTSPKAIADGTSIREYIHDAARERRSRVAHPARAQGDLGVVVERPTRAGRW
jgi:cation diffusion facilitator CzcD-associated flavoprotein CzcO